MAAELEEQIASAETRLAALEEERLFSGRYDAGDALVTVNAGAGGTDAQDWAEMVLRMEMRWAEKRGFDVELLEASPGEEAGIKSATFQRQGRERLRAVLRREGRPPPRAPLAVRRGQPPPDSFAGVEVAPVVDDTGEVEIDDDDIQIDTYRAAAPAASTSTRPTPRCASPTGRRASSSSARTSAPRRRTRRPR